MIHFMGARPIQPQETIKAGGIVIAATLVGSMATCSEEEEKKDNEMSHQKTWCVSMAF